MKKLNNRELTREILEEKGFTMEFFEMEDKRWTNDDGIVIHESSWWLDENDNDIMPAPDSIDRKIKFSFAVITRSSGEFKSGYCVKTEAKLDAIIAALTMREE